MFNSNQKKKYVVDLVLGCSFFFSPVNIKKINKYIIDLYGVKLRNKGKIKLELSQKYVSKIY